MPLTDAMQLISTDDHLVEHTDVYRERVPARFHDAAPHIVDLEDTGAQAWSYQGRIYPEVALNAVAGKPPEEFGMEPMRFDDIRAGCYDPIERLRDMDLDGTWAQLNFPTFAKPAGTMFLRGQDRELALLCVQAVNDFVLDEWCAAAPDRFIPLVVLPLWDVAGCVDEIERTAAKGAKAIGFPEHPVPLKLPSWYTGHWDPVFAAAQAAGLPLCLHFGSSGRVPQPSPEAPPPVWISLMGTNSIETTADLLFSPVLHQFPDLRIVLSEGGVGWMPWLLERCDYTWERHRHYTDVNRDVRPSELFRQHFSGCFIEDLAGLRARDLIGVDNITWESDYPHSDSNWPNSRTRLRDAVEDIPDDEVHKISELNARRLFGLGMARS